jgi:iron complex transport system substrate-binding protein
MNRRPLPGVSLLAILAVAALAAAQPRPSRIVSLIPALTDMLLAIGAGPQLAGVSSYDDDPAVAGLPRVGALLDPDVERIISLKPDLVLAYGSQHDLMTQLERASIPVFSYRHGGLAHVFATIRALGARTGHAAEAHALAASLEKRIEAVRTRVAQAPNKPRVLMVFGREPGALRGIYASGGRGFLHDMLEAAGGVNVFADIRTEAVQVSTEMILTRAPDVILELRSTDVPSADADRQMAPWKALAGVPAVRHGRVHLIAGKSINVPGPLVADGVERIARLLHPDLMQ